MKFSQRFYVWSMSILLISVVSGFSVISCTKDSSKKNTTKSDVNSISVVTTIFAPYDFTRQITKGTSTSIKMLLPPGAEVHSWEPTAQDIIRIQNCNLFIYAGGEGDVWADKLIESSDKKINTVRMIDCVKLFEEAHPEGMEPEEETEESKKQKAEGEEDIEWDEHVWISPANAILITQKICDGLCVTDSANSETYKTNTSEYIAQLASLNNNFRDVVNNATRKTIVFADRFPCRYFVEEFGLSYYAAFPGCAKQTEPSAATVAFIINKVKEEKIPVVFYIEMSNQKMADTVCETTGANKMLFHCLHNLSKDDFKSGKTYIGIMQNNVKALEAALN